MSTAASPDAALAERYHFHDFTVANYRTLLRTAQARYVFRRYTDRVPITRSVIWRHDVDWSMHRAHALAKIEAEEGVRATYFLWPHSEMYNLLERSVTELARSILALGHDVGLHLDTAFHGITEESQLDDVIAWECAMLERLLGRRIAAFSFHNPGTLELGCQREQYAGRINTYAAHFQTTIGYVSDSNGYWRHRRLADVLEQATDQQLQVLTHPEWWTDEPMSPASRIERCIAGRALASRTCYDTLLQRADRQNIGA